MSNLYLLHSASRKRGRAQSSARELGRGATGYIPSTGGGNNSLMAAQNAAVSSQEADELARGSDVLERRAPEKCRSAGCIATVHARPDSERMRARVHIVAIQVHPGFEPQRVARSETQDATPAAFNSRQGTHGIGSGIITSSRSSPYSPYVQRTSRRSHDRRTAEGHRRIRSRS